MPIRVRGKASRIQHLVHIIFSIPQVLTHEFKNSRLKVIRCGKIIYDLHQDVCVVLYWVVVNQVSNHMWLYFIGIYLKHSKIRSEVGSMQQLCKSSCSNLDMMFQSWSLLQANAPQLAQMMITPGGEGVPDVSTIIRGVTKARVSFEISK